MADTILLRAGNKAHMPTLINREIGYCKDEKALYIGTPTGNVKLGGITEEERTAIINEAVAKALEEFAKVTAEV